jgi:predicted nucleic acid-binding protein
MMGTIVIDANVGVSLCVPLTYSPRVRQLWGEWQAKAEQIVVPVLWHYEVLSSLRKAVAGGLLGADGAAASVAALQLMALEEVAPDWGRDRRLLEWAERLDQTVAYGAVYVALAEQLKAQLWTADRRLARAAQDAGAHWVHHVDDTLNGP